jgi:methyl-accepting chemotaxis protein
MNWLKRFGLPGKFTITFAIAIYLPLVIATLFSFEFAKKSEIIFGLKIFNRIADIESETLKAESNRLKGELTILADNNSIKDLLKIHEKNPLLSSEQLMKREDYKKLVDELEMRLKLILPSNPNLYGIGIFFQEKNIIAIDEDKSTHEITIKRNIPVSPEFTEQRITPHLSNEAGIYHNNFSLVFPFNKKNKNILDSVMAYQGFSESPKKTRFIITFFNNPFIKINKLNPMDIKKLDKAFSVILKEEEDGKLIDFNPESDNTNIVMDFLKLVPPSFLNKDSGDFMDKEGNIFTIRKIPIGIRKLEKISIISFLPSHIIREPFQESRNLIIKTLGICSIIVIPFLFFTLRAIINNLLWVTSDLKRTSNTLKNSTKEILETSSIIQKSNKENKISVNQISSFMDQIISSNQSGLVNIKEMSSLSKETSISAIDGRNDLNDLAVSMEQIIESSKNISKIINIIENISLQTNILSMNASVEAARAGEHGKGFAVVAEAIRNLSQKSAQSAGEIEKQIRQSIEISEKGSLIAAQNRAKFKEIIENIEKLNIVVEKTTEAIGGRTVEINKLGDELKKINIAVSEGSLQIEKHGEIATKLTAEADSLKESINKILNMVEGVKKNGNNAS